MDQDSVKQMLLQLNNDVPEFSVIFTGKSSKKVNGLYRPETMEILIHNHNFDNDNLLLYTAIHEYAHHVNFSQQKAGLQQVERRAHTITFRNTLHQLLDRAEELGFYQNVFETNPDFQELTRKIKEQYLGKNGALMKELGRILIEAFDLCQQYKVSFEDYIERALTMQRTQAKSIMKVFALDLDPKVGFDNMKIASSVKDPKQRKYVETMLEEGKTADEARAFIRETKARPEETFKKLEAEKHRIERTLTKLQERLSELEQKLQNITN